MSTPRSDELLLAAGHEVWTTYGTFVKRTLPEEAVDLTFSRSSVASFRDRSLHLREAESGVLRPHWVSSESQYGMRLEASRTNLVTESENFANWTTTGTPTSSSGESDPEGGTSAFLLGDDDGAAFERFDLAVSFTGDAQKSFAFYVKEGDSPPSQFQAKVRDVTGGADRGALIVTGWTDGEPTVSASTGTFLGKRELSDGWWRLLGQTTSITAANSHEMQVLPAVDGTADTGDVRVWGVQAEDATFPSSYIATSGTTVTRSADSLSVPIGFGPKDLTAYAKWVEGGTIFLSGGGRVFQLGESTSSGTSSLLLAAQSGPTYRAFHHGSGFENAGGLGAPAIGDTVEAVVQFNVTNLTLTAQLAINGVAQTEGSTSISDVGDTFRNDKLFINSESDTSQVGFADFLSLAVAPGVRTLSEMRGVEV